MNHYISQADLEKRVGNPRFTNLCGARGIEQSVLVEEIIARAESLIDGFAAVRYQTPMEKTALIEEWVLAIAEYELYKRGPGGSVPEKIRESYRTALSQLEALSAGKIRTGGSLSGRERASAAPAIQVLQGRNSVMAGENW